MSRKKKKTIFAVCAAAVIVIGFLTYFLMWGIYTNAVSGANRRWHR